MCLIRNVFIFIMLLFQANALLKTPCIYGNETFEFIQHWPCDWRDGFIPFVFDFYCISLKRLIALVRKGHSYIEQRSCLKFKEINPAVAAKNANFTYLYYTYSGVLENCCLPFFTKPVGRRMVLITPTCTLPADIAHVTLHGLGLSHHKGTAFSEYQVRTLLLSGNCINLQDKIKMFEYGVMKN